MNSPPTATALHDFGQVAEHGDSFEFFVDRAAGAVCRMVAVVQTERGPKRTLLAEIPGALWRRIGPRAVRELAQGMGDDERGRAKAPTLKTGGNRLSPLLGRELTLLLWTLQEDGADAELEAILQGWRELAREERWWLFSKASAPGQRTGLGWRRALFHALAEAPDSRAAALQAEKKARHRRPPARRPPGGGRPSRARRPQRGGRAAAAAQPVR
jgi:hypothetical protein